MTAYTFIVNTDIRLWRSIDWTYTTNSDWITFFYKGYQWGLFLSWMIYIFYLFVSPDVPPPGCTYKSKMRSFVAIYWCNDVITPTTTERTNNAVGGTILCKITW